MITTRAMPALLSVHQWRVASGTTVNNDFAGALTRSPAELNAEPPRAGIVPFQGAGGGDSEAGSSLQAGGVL